MCQRVFISVPFDKAYKPFLDATVFTVIACGCAPRCALATGNVAQMRFARIVELIKQCPMSIHDRSRSGSGQNNQLPRLNMPFELGLFLGAREFGGKSHKVKTCIVLDSHSRRYRSLISDLAGYDVVSHNNRISCLINVLRDWFAAAPGVGGTRILPGGKEVYGRYVEFQKKLPKMCHRAKIQRTKLRLIRFFRTSPAAPLCVGG